MTGTLHAKESQWGNALWDTDNWYAIPTTPTVTGINDLTISPGTSQGVINFAAEDSDTQDSELTVTATSDPSLPLG